VAIRSLWVEKENKKWEEKLEEIKNQIKMNVLMCLWQVEPTTFHTGRDREVKYEMGTRRGRRASSRRALTKGLAISSKLCTTSIPP
jgi:hypothetical protein